MDGDDLLNPRPSSSQTKCQGMPSSAPKMNSKKCNGVPSTRIAAAIRLLPCLFRFPVTFDQFKKYTHYQEPLEKILQEIREWNRTSYEEIQKDPNAKEQILFDYYKLFYMRPDVRKRYPLQLKACPAVMKKHLLHRPYIDSDEENQEKSVEPNMQREQPKILVKSPVINDQEFVKADSTREKNIRKCHKKISVCKRSSSSIISSRDKGVTKSPISKRVKSKAIDDFSPKSRNQNAQSSDNSTQAESAHDNHRVQPTLQSQKESCSTKKTILLHSTISHTESFVRAYIAKNVNHLSQEIKQQIRAHLATAHKQNEEQINSTRARIESVEVIASDKSQYTMAYSQNNNKYLQKQYLMAYVLRMSSGLKQRITAAILNMSFEEFRHYTHIHCGTSIYSDFSILNRCYQHTIVEQRLWPVNLYIKLSDMLQYLYLKGINLKGLQLSHISPKFLHWTNLTDCTDFDKCVHYDYIKTTGYAIKESDVLLKQREHFYKKCWLHECWIWREPIIIDRNLALQLDSEVNIGATERRNPIFSDDENTTPFCPDNCEYNYLTLYEFLKAKARADTTSKGKSQTPIDVSHSEVPVALNVGSDENVDALRIVTPNTEECSEIEADLPLSAEKVPERAGIYTETQEIGPETEELGRVSPCAKENVQGIQADSPPTKEFGEEIDANSSSTIEIFVDADGSIQFTDTEHTTTVIVAEACNEDAVESTFMPNVSNIERRPAAIVIPNSSASGLNTESGGHTGNMRVLDCSEDMFVYDQLETSLSKVTSTQNAEKDPLPPNATYVVNASPLSAATSLQGDTITALETQNISSTITSESNCSVVQSNTLRPPLFTTHEPANLSIIAPTQSTTACLPPQSASKDHPSIGIPFSMRSPNLFTPSSGSTEGTQPQEKHQSVVSETMDYTFFDMPNTQEQINALPMEESPESPTNVNNNQHEPIDAEVFGFSEDFGFIRSVKEEFHGLNNLQFILEEGEEYKCVPLSEKVISIEDAGEGEKYISPLKLSSKSILGSCEQQPPMVCIYDSRFLENDLTLSSTVETIADVAAATTSEFAEQQLLSQRDAHLIVDSVPTECHSLQRTEQLNMRRCEEELCGMEIPNEQPFCEEAATTANTVAETALNTRVPLNAEITKSANLRKTTKPTTRKAATKKAATDLVPQLTHEFRALPIQIVKENVVQSTVTNTLEHNTVMAASSTTTTTTATSGTMSVSLALETDCTLFNTQLLDAVDVHINTNATQSTAIVPCNNVASNGISGSTTTDKDTTSTSTSSTSVTTSTSNQVITNELIHSPLKLHKSLLYRTLHEFHYFRQLTEEHLMTYTLCNNGLTRCYMEALISSGRKTVVRGKFLDKLIWRCSSKLLNDFQLILNDLQEFHYNRYEANSDNYISPNDLRQKVLIHFLNTLPAFSYCHLKFESPTRELGHCHAMLPHTNDTSTRRPHCLVMSIALKPRILERLAELKAKLHSTE